MSPSMAEAFLWKGELKADVQASVLSYSYDRIPCLVNAAKEGFIWAHGPSWWGRQGSRSKRWPATLHPVKQE